MSSSSELRQDWLQRRSEFVRAQAEERWPASPVASDFERRLRADYIRSSEAAAEVVDTADFIAVASDEKEPSSARWGFGLGALIGAVAGLTVAVTVNVIVGPVLTVVLTVIGALAGFYPSLLLIGAIRRESFNRKVDAMLADREAYFAWVEHSRSDDEAA